MTSQLPADCLNEIFEYLEEDKITLHSCLLVDRLWCGVSVRILWRDVWTFKYTIPIQYRLDVPSQIFNTLIACLPNESKELFYKNGIFIAAQAWKPSLFNYASFCKNLSIREVDLMIRYSVEKQQYSTSHNLNFNKYLVLQEILKMYMSQISSLKSLDYDLEISKTVQNILFTYFPGAKGCLANLSIFSCDSNICSEFFYQLSQICHNIQALTITFENVISNGLADLISLQKNLQHVTLIAAYGGENDWTEIITSLAKFPLTKLKMFGYDAYMPLSFLSTFTHLQEIILSFDDTDILDFNKLQYVKFPHLQILKFQYAFPKVEMLIKFLEINGKNLTEFYVGYHDNSLNLAVAKSCPNLKKLYLIFMKNEIETLKVVFNSCQHLESIKIVCGAKYLGEKEMLDVVSKYSPKNFYELKVDNYTQSKLLPEELESFFTIWSDRIPQRSLSLIIVFVFNDDISLYVNDENMKIIEKFKKLGIIRKLGTESFEEI
ncbi:15598_t:CDS:1 [Funneliformis geosporum]|uniref:15598_t:CDS:1 n=1 Tax=Funneliformis geosporum TaxID=1117311 RepID=A0A9W4SBS2_9GLOM|nr:15598_t:CDS:1 [Funneliformis geosporum]